MSPAPPTPSGTAPGSVTSLRTANQRRVIEVLRDRPGPTEVTQAAIARVTGLAPATVSNIVRELVAADVVETTAGAGRRGTTVRISRRAGLIAGIDVGHSHLRVALGDMGGTIVGEARQRLAPTHALDEALDAMEALLDKLLLDLQQDRNAVVTAGMGLPTPIEAAGRITDASILPGWVGVDPAAVVGRRLDRTVHVDNDANLGALAEHRWGAGRGHRCMAYVKVSSGVGCGLVFDGKVFRGGTGMAGELGHLTIDDDGPLCRCGGRGCLEAYCSISTVRALLADQLPGADLPEIVQAATRGNAAAVRAIEDAGHHLGWGIAHLANLINPTRIVIGGDLAQAGDLLLDAVGVALRRRTLGGVGSSVTLRASALGGRSSVVGAMLLAMGASELAPGGSA
jgi:predicted NBD/HSP70 family sugar kinase